MLLILKYSRLANFCYLWILWTISASYKLLHVRYYDKSQKNRYGHVFYQSHVRYRKCQKLLVAYSADIINRGSEINEVISRNAWIPSARKQREYNLYKEDAQRLYDDFKMVENAFKVGGTSIFKIIFYIIAGIIR